jgi:hypothetical protein
MKRCHLPCCGGAFITRYKHKQHQLSTLHSQPALPAFDVPAVAAPEDDDSDVDGEQAAPDHFKHLCKEYIDLVARNQVTVSGMSNILKVNAAAVVTELPSELRPQYPSTWHQVKKVGKVAGSGGLTYYRDFCPACGSLFRIGRWHTYCGCGGARFDIKGGAVVQALYYDIPDKLTRLLLNRHVFHSRLWRD